MFLYQNEVILLFESLGRPFESCFPYLHTGFHTLSIWIKVFNGRTKNERQAMVS